MTTKAATSDCGERTANMAEEQTDLQRVALVTGASRGIGAAIAQRLAHDGFAVVVNHSGEHSRQAAEELASRISEEYGVPARAMQADVSDFEQAKDLVGRVVDEFGRLDVLVNNAGINRDALLARMKEEDFDRVIETNLKGAFNCMRHAAVQMMHQRYGRIISLSSVAGVAGNAGQVNYAASKAGIIGMTKSAAKELARRNITANAVAPGFIDTQMTQAMPQKYVDMALANIAAGRKGTPEDVAAAVAFFAREDAGYVTGQVLRVDGGMSI
jgi:3-oxoacyl-[acyl-carrier protein] reductase